MTDQDTDGSHIKGLIVNMLHHYWPELLKVRRFLTQFITPIVKCMKGTNGAQTFYTIPQYEAWRNETNQAKGWKIKVFFVSFLSFKIPTRYSAVLQGSRHEYIQGSKGVLWRS